MSENDRLKRVLDLGLQLTGLTWQRAEGMIREAAEAAGASREQAQAVAGDLLEKGRQSGERLLDIMRQEINDSVAAMGLVTSEEFDALERRVARLEAVATAESAGRDRLVTKAAKATKVAKAKKVAKVKKTAKPGPATKATKAKKATQAAKAAKRAPTKVSANGGATKRRPQRSAS